MVELQQPPAVGALRQLSLKESFRYMLRQPWQSQMIRLGENHIMTATRRGAIAVIYSSSISSTLEQMHVKNIKCNVIAIPSTSRYVSYNISEPQYVSVQYWSTRPASIHVCSCNTQKKHLESRPLTEQDQWQQTVLIQSKEVID